MTAVYSNSYYSSTSSIYSRNQHVSLQELPTNKSELHDLIAKKEKELMGEYKSTFEFFKKELGEAMVGSKMNVINKAIHELAKKEVSRDLVNAVLKFSMKSISESSQKDLKSTLDIISGSTIAGNVFSKLWPSYNSNQGCINIKDISGAHHGDRFSVTVNSIAKKEVLLFPQMDTNAKVGSSGSCGISSTSCIEPGEIVLTLKNKILKILDKKFDDRESSVVSIDGSSGTKFKAGYFYINNKSVELKDGQSLNDIAKLINLSKIGVRAEIKQDNSSKYYILLQPTLPGGKLKIDDISGIIGTITNEVPSVSINISEGDSIPTIISKFNNAAQGTASISYNVYGNKISCSLYSGLTGTENKVDMTFMGTPPTKDGTGSGRFFETFSTLQPASDTDVVFDNIPIQTSQINVLDIGLPGGGNLTLELLKETPSGESVNFTVLADLSSINKNIESFIIGYAKFMHQLSKLEDIQHGYLSSFIKKELIELKETQKILSAKILNGDSIYLRDPQGNTIGMPSIGIKFLDSSNLGLFFSDDIEKANSIQDLENLGVISFDDRLFQDSIENNLEFMASLFISGVNGSKNFRLESGKDVMANLRVTPLELEINLDSTKEAILSNASKLFNTTTESIGLSEGAIQIGENIIKVGPSDSLESLNLKINALKIGVTSKISVFNSKNFLNLASVNNYSSPDSILYDYDGVLNGLFTPNPEEISSKEFAADRLVISDPDINPAGGTFVINGAPVTIEATDKLPDLVTKINNLHVGVTASIEDLIDVQILKITSNTVEINDEIIIEDNDSVIINALIIPAKNPYATKFKDYSKVVTAQAFDGDEFIDRKVSYIPGLSKVLFIKWHGNPNQEFAINGIKLLYNGSYSSGINEKISINYALVDRFAYNFDSIRNEISSVTAKISTNIDTLNSEYKIAENKLHESIQKASIDLGESLKKRNQRKAEKNAIGALLKIHNNDRREDL
ncbi:Flagellar hook protein FliD [Candidatus Cyrtobacter comes]|uniref:Flagellar hook protein FliD n=1 Tax=Candidatus Cyrtobacter comes TaxID=675776 RepID=A0ABU5L777_9RICK|nr:flagellar filament capping protein FliD [Candidatus Cyrtobacter comes]MDZ5761986.1 Flagellar hook protein FliD [Candidatus Cyrtobacter comes]